MEIMDAIAAEREDLAELLRSLSEPDWDRATLCEGWRVREVVAHMTYPFRVSPPKFIAELVRARGSFNRLADRAARREAAELSATDLVRSLEENTRHPWKPPGGGLEGALSHDVIHGLDISVSLGLGRKVPEDRLRVVLGGTESARARRFFGVDLTGVELRADDLDWSLGSGEPLHGSAQNLLLVVCGRKLPPGHLQGSAASRFTKELPG